MAERFPLFLGLTRPPRYFGLPLGYFFGLSMAGILPFIVTDSAWFLLVWAAGYPPLWLLSDRDPNLIELFVVATSKTPKTPNEGCHGGHVYVS